MLCYNALLKTMATMFDARRKKGFQQGVKLDQFVYGVWKTCSIG